MPLNCSHPREDGSAADTEGMALVFTEPVSELDAGLYICHVSYHHHTANVFIRVDVTSEETQHSEFPRIRPRLSIMVAYRSVVNWFVMNVWFPQ